MVGSNDGSVEMRPMEMLPIMPEEAFLGAGRSLMRGAQLLAAVDPESVAAAAPALTMLAGQILESLLKAFLVKRGLIADDLKKKPFGHDLKNLWQRARSEGMPIAIALPAWATHLQELHAGEYVLRYPMGLHGMGYPPAQPMMDDLAIMLATVEQELVG